MSRIAINLACIAMVVIMTLGTLCSLRADTPLATQFQQNEISKGYVVFEHSIMQNLTPTHVPARNAITANMSCALAQGEYKSLQIGVHAIEDNLTNISIIVTSDLDVTIYHRIHPSTKTELATDPVEVPVWMPSEVYLQPGHIVSDLAKGRSVNFWLTFYADPQMSSGIYRGKIRIEVDGRPTTELDLAVQVRPFQLAAAQIPFGMYYREDMLPHRFGGWALTNKLSLYRDMASHSQNSMTFHQAGDFSELPPRNSLLVRNVGLAKEAGLVHLDIPCMAIQHNLLPIQAHYAGISESQMKAAVTWLETNHRRQGWPDILLYGWDEAPYQAPSLRKTYAPLRTLPIRLGAAMNSAAVVGHGDLHDVWIVIGGEITPEMCAEAARLGAQVWTYSYRIWREGFSPLRERYYAGLYTWAHQLGGNYVWAYSNGHHSHVWFEPGSHKPLPTTAWEARREGVDDYRYLQMVEDLVARSTNEPIGMQAAAWLKRLRERLTTIDPHEAEPGKPLAIEEYERIRAMASDFIVKLGPWTAPAPPLAKYLKDEAAAFRGQSVEQCIATLSSSDNAQCRGAAWALFEMGPKAAPAVTTLMTMLDIPEVRFPALRALAAIGREAYVAAPVVASLLSHPDDFVRLSAIFTLADIAQPPTWNRILLGYAADNPSPHAHILVPLFRKAMHDSKAPIAMAASLGLFRCGEAALPALVDAVRLVEGRERAVRDAGNLREAGLHIMAGMGPAAADVVPLLVTAYAQAKGQNALVARTLAAIGPAASDAIAVLEEFSTPDNSCLADTYYALFCIRGDESDLRMLVNILGDQNRPYADRQAAIRYLTALGAKAEPVAAMVRERLPLLDAEPNLRGQLESYFFERVEHKATPLKLW